MSMQKTHIKDVASMLTEEPCGFGRPVSDRTSWETLARHDAFRYVIPNAEETISQPIPDLPDDLYLDFSRTGNRTRWQAVSGQRRSRVSGLALAECLEDRGRFLPAMEAIVRALCDERTWVMPAHDREQANFDGTTIDIDLGSAMLAWDLAMADYLLRQKLNSEIRRLVSDNIQCRIFKPFKDMVEGKREPNWWMTTTNNWNAVCLAGVTGSALALLESREQRAFFVTAAEMYSRHFLQGFTDDGYCSEGVGYWNYGFGHYLLLAEAIYQATRGGLDLLNDSRVETIAGYARGMEIINGVYPAFADCAVDAQPERRIMCFISRRLGLGMQPYESEDTTAAEGPLYTSMMYSFPNSASTRPQSQTSAEDRHLRTWFRAGGVLICRPQEQSDCALGVALKGGHNDEHHNHNDLGSYVVVGRCAVLVDPGSEVYTARTFGERRYDSKVLNSFGHPVPVVAGQLQSMGEHADARLVRTEFTRETDTLALDIRSAYDVEELKTLTRTFVYSRENTGMLTVTDEVAFTSFRTFETALIIFGRWRQCPDGSIHITDNEDAVRVEISVSGSDFEIQAEELREDLTTPTLPTRLGIRLTQPVTGAVVTLRITPLL